MIVTADLHLKIWNDIIDKETGLPLRLRETLDSFDKMIEVSKEKNIKNFIISGDINDTFNTAHSKPFLLLKERFNYNKNINFFLLHGNHDGHINHSTIRFFEGDNVFIIDKIKELIIEDKKILFIPYFLDGDLIEFLKNDFKNFNPDIIIGHFGLNDKRLYSGMIKTQIDSDYLGDTAKISILGHYHKPQNINVGETSIYYVGSPVPMRKDEIFDEKRFLIVEEDLKIVSIETNCYRKGKIVEVINESDLNFNGEDNNDYIILKIKNKDLLDKIKFNKGVFIEKDYEEEYKENKLTFRMGKNEIFEKYLVYKNVEENKRDKYMVAVGSLIDGNH